MALPATSVGGCYGPIWGVSPLFHLHPLKSSFSEVQDPQSSQRHLSSTQGTVLMTPVVLEVNTGESCPSFGVETEERAREHCTEPLGSRHSVLRPRFCRSVCLLSDKLLCSLEHPRLICRSPKPLCLSLTQILGPQHSPGHPLFPCRL